MKTQKTGAYLLAGTALAAVLTPTCAYAQGAGQIPEEPVAEETGGLSEIIVTAQRREENLQEVPISIAAVTAEALEQTGVDTTRDLPQIVPSVQFTRSGASGLFFVRGVGTTNAAAGEEGANAVYVDGVYLADLAQTINNFNNIERIEVLKGPQGTLFGRNATGGLIHIITREPGDELVVNGEFGGANYETVSSRLYLAAPIIEDKLSWDLAWTGLNQNEGYGRNITLNRKVKVQENWGVRSKAVLRASERVKLTLGGDYFKSDDNVTLAYNLAPGTVGSNGILPAPGWYDSRTDIIPFTKLEIWGGSLTAEADVGFATLTSISAYRKSNNSSDLDVDGGPIPLVRITFESGAKSIQQELRLASNDTEPFAWQIGGFYLHTLAENDSFFSGAAFGALRGQQILAKLKTNSYAAFGEATYSITPTTKLTGGIRYTTDRRNFDASQFNILPNGTALPGGTVTVPSRQPLAAPGVQRSKLKYNRLTWRVALRQELTDDISVFGSVNKGFKSGSFSLQNPLNDPYLPQSIVAYEVGIKSQLFDRRLRLNVAAFHYDIKDYQVRSAAVANPGASLILNAATVKVDGVELEFEAAPTEELRIFGGAVYLDSRYGKFGGPGAAFQAPIVYPNFVNPPDPTDLPGVGPTGTRGVCPAALRGTPNPGVMGTGGLAGGYTTCFGDVSGLRTMNAPKFSASLGASYIIPLAETGRLRLTALYSYNSGYVFEPDNVSRQSSYSLLNGSVEYRPNENFGVEVWGRNITRTKYAVQKITTGTGVTMAVGTPRTYGVNFKFDF